MLNHEQCIAAIAQIVHHSDEAADIARMEADTWFVHDKKRIDERCAQTGRKIHPLHFATAQRAGRAIKRQITDADFAQIIQTRANFVAQHFRSRVVPCDADFRQEVARIGNRKSREIRKREQVFVRGDFEIERFGLKPSAVAVRASRIGAVAAEQDAHVHFVNLRFEPAEKPAHAIPTVVLVIFVTVTLPAFARGGDRLFPVNDELLVCFRQFLERQVDIDLLASAGAQQILL